MHDTANAPASPDESRQVALFPWRIAAWLCALVVVASIGACIIMAAARSTGLSGITLTALAAEAEPRDHKLPFIKQKETLPDYELTIILTGGEKLRLGTKPDASAADGLTWRLNDPVSVAEVASVRLREKDKVVSDAVAEVQVLGDSAMQNGYRFDFALQHSTSVGVKSFFRTPIGKAIAAGFGFAILLLVLSILLPVLGAASP